MLSMLAIWATIARDYLAGRTRALAGESGQDFIEYALVIGVIVLVLIAAFLTTDIKFQVAELSGKISCSIKGGTWTAGTSPTPGTCA